MVHHTVNARAKISTGAHPKHLLWGLMWLKIYSTEAVMAGMAKCDEKMFEKWSWKFVVAVSLLKEKVVSISQCCLLFLGLRFSACVSHRAFPAFLTVRFSSFSTDPIRHAEEESDRASLVVGRRNRLSDI